MLARTTPLRRADTRPRKRNAGRPAEKSAPAFLQWLRGRQCAIAGRLGHVCSGRIEAAHVDHAGGKGIGTKVADRHAISLCTGAHDEQHRRGWATFERIYMLDAMALAADFWRQWPGRAKWEAAHG
jgi:hypothetical protein